LSSAALSKSGHLGTPVTCGPRVLDSAVAVGSLGGNLEGPSVLAHSFRTFEQLLPLSRAATHSHSHRWDGSAPVTLLAFYFQWWTDVVSMQVPLSRTMTFKVVSPCLVEKTPRCETYGGDPSILLRWPPPSRRTLSNQGRDIPPVHDTSRIARLLVDCCRRTTNILLFILSIKIHNPTSHIGGNRPQAIVPFPLFDAEVVWFLFS